MDNVADINRSIVSESLDSHTIDKDTNADQIEIEEELPKSKGQKYDDLLMEIGGFGKFQCRVVFCFIMTLMSGFWYQYPISFLELPPKYECLYPDSID